MNYYEAYHTIKNSNTKCGVFRKTLFHLHTPASYDYHLISGWSFEDYLNSSAEDLVEICCEKMPFLKELSLESYALNAEQKEVFLNKKEWLAYLLIAHELFINRYEIVLVSDHNTIDGIRKIKHCVKEYYDLKKESPYPNILSALELSCADKLHVVIAFNENDSGLEEQIQKWLQDHLISLRDGTYETSISVINYFSSIGCFCYIAHLNTSNLFKDNHFLSGAYKKKLIQERCLNIVGVNSSNDIQKMENIFHEHKITGSKYLIDNDAHDIDSIKDNYFWIKTGNIRFNGVREALLDFDVSVSYKNENASESFIYGLCIEYSPVGFLARNNSAKNENETKEKPFVLSFSNSLNCLIGGRGTGKSTILEVLEYALSLRVDNKKMLEYICKHGTVFVLYIDKNDEYLIELSLPKTTKGRDILFYFGQNEADRFFFNYSFSEEKVKEYTLKHYIKIYKVDTTDKRQSFTEITSGRMKLLSKLYDGRYSINELVKIAGDDEIDDFIRQHLFRGVRLVRLNYIEKTKGKTDILKSFNKLQNLLEKRKRQIFQVLEPFNQYEDNRIRVCYKQEIDFAPEFKDWVHADKGESFFIEDTITYKNVWEYLYYVYDNVGFIEFINMAFNPKKKEEKYKYSVRDFARTNNIDERANRRIINEIFDHISGEENIGNVVSFFEKIVSKCEKLTLEFNISSHGGGSKEPHYRDVSEISLGQKVVAMLDFVLGYGMYIGDNRPLLLDQPEDNLDSQFIYKNLVKELRKVKSERQIIIATHNATIVTNAMTDLVCYMKSDGIHGWVEHAGYPSEKNIKKDIVNTLEGGIDSFNHKKYIYGPVL